MPVEPQGIDLQAGKSNYFIGRDSSSWQRSVSHFEKVLYPQVYSGIDLAFHSAGRDFEYDFFVEPGRNPQSIAVDFVGAAHLKLDSEGNLILATAAGNVCQKKPIAYQVKANRRVPVDAAASSQGPSR